MRVGMSVCECAWQGDRETVGGEGQLRGAGYGGGGAGGVKARVMVADVCVSAWVGGWVGGWVGVRACARVVYLCVAFGFERRRERERVRTRVQKPRGWGGS